MRLDEKISSVAFGRQKSESDKNVPRIRVCVLGASAVGKTGEFRREPIPRDSSVNNESLFSAGVHSGTAPGQCSQSSFSMRTRALFCLATRAQSKVDWLAFVALYMLRQRTREP